MKPDFSGWATKYDIKCTDGRTIMKDAFQHMDGEEVPLIWSHKHDDPELILGHAAFTAKPEGLWFDAFFNNGVKAVASKELVHAKNIKAVSIWANQLVERAGQVFHGAVKELSLVISGANKGATIEFVNMVHGDGTSETFDDVAVIFMGENIVHVDGDVEEVEEPVVEETTETTVVETEDSTQVESDLAAASKDAATDDVTDETVDGEIEHAEGPSPETVRAFYAGLPEQEQEIVMHMVGAALLSADSTAAEHSATTDESDSVLAHQEGNTMTRSVFEGKGAVTTDTGKVLSHSDIEQFATQVRTDFLQPGRTFKQAVLAHAGEYGITNIEVLFPDAKTIDQKPEWITRRMEWVETVLNGMRKVPWSKIKSMSADLTHEEARAKGYIKGTMKVEQFFEIAFRETGPKTIYKKQKLDRDDIIDMTDFDVVAWLWVEMRFMLREEVARAVLIGDGRLITDPDKINESSIRPIASDHTFYTDRLLVPTATTGIALVDAVLEGREPYEGSNPTAFMTRATMNEMLLARDNDDRRHFRTRADLAAELDVDKIELVPVMKNALVGTDDLLMIIVNMGDYAFGQTRGGEITTFEDFDIDVNQHKYLIETRGSGALIKHKTAQVVLRTPAI